MNCVACIEIIKLCIFHFDEIPEIPSKIPHKMALNAIGKLSHACAVKKRNNWSVCGTHPQHTLHTQGMTKLCGSWVCWNGGRGYVIKYANNCKMKMCVQSQTKRNAQSISNTFWLALSINNTLQAHTTSNSSNSNNNKERRHQGATLALRVGWGAWLVASIYLCHARECKQIKLQIMISCLTARTLSAPLPLPHPKLDKTRATKMSHTNWAMYEHFNIIIYSHTLHAHYESSASDFALNFKQGKGRGREVVGLRSAGNCRS